MSYSPAQLAKLCKERVDRQNWRVGKYRIYLNEYKGTRGDGGSNGTFRGSYADGRPALQDLSELHGQLQQRPGAPNWIKPIIDDAVAVGSPLPTITFDPASDQPSDMQQAEICSMAVRGQYEISQMAVAQVKALLWDKLFGEVCYTLDPLTPKAAKESNDPFALPGVYINVQNPMQCYPRFGTGREINRIQDLFLVYGHLDPEEVAELYPDQMGFLNKSSKVQIILYYGKDYKKTILAQDQQAVEAYHADYNYGFCPAVWAVNKVAEEQFGTSEIDQTVHLHKTSQALFHLAMDSAIIATFPPIHVHQPEHVGKARYGPLAVIETVEDGRVEMLTSGADSQVPTTLLDMASGNLFKQTGVSPIRMEGDVSHANTSGRALNAAQGPMEARLAMSNVLLGSALEQMNSMISLILYKDPDFRKTEMSVYGINSKGSKQAITFKGEDLGGLMRNHVRWSSPIGGNIHEEMTIYLQLYQAKLVPGRKVLEVTGEDNPEQLIREARQEAQQAAQMQPHPGPGGPPGGAAGGAPSGGSPTSAAQDNVSLGAGSLQGGGGPTQPPSAPPSGGPPPSPGGAPGGMPAFPPLQAPPNATLQVPPPPDIWGMVKQVEGTLKLHGEIIGAVGTKDGILVTVTSGKDIAMVKMALKPVAQQVSGPSAKVHIHVEPKGEASSSQ